MTLRRTTTGINKAEDAGRMDAQIGFADALRRIFPTVLVSHLAFRGRICQWARYERMSVTFDLRQCANCRLADVLSSAACARRGGVHGQQCDISGDFVVGGIRLLLQQRWLTEQALGERNYETRR